MTKEIISAINEKNKSQKTNIDNFILLCDQAEKNGIKLSTDFNRAYKAITREYKNTVKLHEQIKESESKVNAVMTDFILSNANFYDQIIKLNDDINKAKELAASSAGNQQQKTAIHHSVQGQ